MMNPTTSTSVSACWSATWYGPCWLAGEEREGAVELLADWLRVASSVTELGARRTVGASERLRCPQPESRWRSWREMRRRLGQGPSADDLDPSPCAAGRGGRHGSFSEKLKFGVPRVQTSNTCILQSTPSGLKITPRM